MDVNAVQSIFSSPFQTNSMALLSPSSYPTTTNGCSSSNPHPHMINPHPTTTTTAAATAATTTPSPVIITNLVDTARLFALAMAEVLVTAVQNMEGDASAYGNHILLTLHLNLTPHLNTHLNPCNTHLNPCNNHHL